MIVIFSYLKVASVLLCIHALFHSKTIASVMIRLSCGVKCTRIILAILNAVFLVFGFALFGFGIYLKVSKKFDVALSDHINAQVIGGEAIGAVGIILIVTGIFTVILTIFGVLGTRGKKHLNFSKENAIYLFFFEGALLKNRFYLYAYAFIPRVFMVLELAAFITTMNSRVRIRGSYA